MSKEGLRVRFEDILKIPGVWEEYRDNKLIDVIFVSSNGKCMTREGTVLNGLDVLEYSKIADEKEFQYDYDWILRYEIPNI